MQERAELLEVILHLLAFLLGYPLAEEAPGQRIALVVEKGVLGLAVGAEGDGVNPGILGVPFSETSVRQFQENCFISAALLWRAAMIWLARPSFWTCGRWWMERPWRMSPGRKEVVLLSISSLLVVLVDVPPLMV